MKMIRARVLLITISILLLFMFSSPTYAEVATPSDTDYLEEYEDEDLETDEIMLINDLGLDIDQSAVAYSDDNMAASYSVEIPKSIQMQKKEDQTFEATYQIKIINLDETDERSCLVIEPDSEFSLNAENKKSITAYVEQEETEFSNLIQEDLSVMHTTNGYVFTKEPLSSAYWTGSFSFNFSLLDLGATEALGMYELEKIEELEKVEDLEVLEDLEVATPSDATKIEQPDKELESDLEQDVKEDLISEDLTDEELTDENLTEENEISNNNTDISLDEEPAEDTDADSSKNENNIDDSAPDTSQEESNSLDEESAENIGSLESADESNSEDSDETDDNVELSEVNNSNNEDRDSSEPADDSGEETGNSEVSDSNNDNGEEDTSNNI